MPVLIDSFVWIEYFRHGSNIADLFIVQNAQQHNASLYSLDSHFRRMSDALALTLFL